MTTPTTALAEAQREMNQAVRAIDGSPAAFWKAGKAASAYTALAYRIIAERDERIAKLEAALKEAVEIASEAGSEFEAAGRDEQATGAYRVEYRVRALARAALEDA